MAHGIFRSDNCTYTHDPAKIRTIQTYGEIDNGAPILLGALASTGKYAGEREVFTTSAATGANAADCGAFSFSVTLKFRSDLRYILRIRKIAFIDTGYGGI